MIMVSDAQPSRIAMICTHVHFLGVGTWRGFEKVSSAKASFSAAHSVMAASLSWEAKTGECGVDQLFRAGSMACPTKRDQFSS